MVAHQRLMQEDFKFKTNLGYKFKLSFKKSLKYTLLFSKRHCTNMFTNIICVVDTLLFYRQGSRSLRNSHAQCHMARNCLVLVYIVPDITYPLDYNNLKCVDICYV